MMPSWIKWICFYACVLIVVFAVISPMAERLKRPTESQAPNRQLGGETRAAEPLNDASLPSLPPGADYVRKREDGLFDIFQPVPDAFRAVKAEEPAKVQSVSLPDSEDFQAVVLTDSRGQHSLRLKKVELRPGQQLHAGEIIGYRHAVLHISVGLRDPFGRPLDIRSNLPPMVPSPENTYYKKRR